MSSEQQVADLLKRWLKVEETMEEHIDPQNGQQYTTFNQTEWMIFKNHLRPSDFVALANIAEWSKHG